jgi:hypothetical protein
MIYPLISVGWDWRHLQNTSESSLSGKRLQFGKETTVLVYTIPRPFMNRFDFHLVAAEYKVEGSFERATLNLSNSRLNYILYYTIYLKSLFIIYCSISFPSHNLQFYSSATLCTTHRVGSTTVELRNKTYLHNLATSRIFFRWIVFQVLKNKTWILTTVQL